MIKSIKTRTPILALILFVFAVGYTVAAKVVVVPLGGDSQPSGMVSSFNSETCPTGWVKYQLATGRVVVGLNDSGFLGITRGTALKDNGSESHSHKWAFYEGSTRRWGAYNSAGNGIDLLIDWGDGMDANGSGFYPLAVDGTVSSSENYYTNTADHTPPYVQLLYCEKV
jgi:hypothetical protein